MTEFELADAVETKWDNQQKVEDFNKFMDKAMAFVMNKNHGGKK